MPKPFRVAFAIDLATASAVRWFCIGAHQYAHERLDWEVQRDDDTSMLNWEQAIAAKPDGILGILEPDFPLDARRVRNSHVVILNTAVMNHRFHSVITDDVEAGRRAAAHLLERRLQHFAYVGCRHVHFSELRQRGFEEYLRDAGVEHPIYFEDIDTAKYAPKQFSRWLRSLPLPCGLLAANDGMALRTIGIAQSLGLTVPDDIAAIGISNDELSCIESKVTLSSVGEDFVAVGYHAAEHLDKLMRGKPVEGNRILIPPGEVTERESTRVIGVPDPIVRRALLLIHQDATSALTVDSLLAAMPRVSRRQLETRFRQTVGRSPYKEILHTRIRRAQRMLLRTRLPIGEVALRSGFYDTPQFCRHFKSISGCTPLQYRSASKETPVLLGG